MASLHKQKTSTGEAWRIQFNGSGARKSIFLGKISKKMGETVCNRVEQIQACNLVGLPYPPDVAQWLGVIGDELHEKLSDAGLVERRASRMLQSFLDEYQEERTDWKPATRRAFQTARNKLMDILATSPCVPSPANRRPCTALIS